MESNRAMSALIFYELESFSSSLLLLLSTHIEDTAQKLVIAAFSPQTIRNHT